MRIDDETSGIPLVSTAPGAFAGELLQARGCYICKTDFTLVDAFYHWLCPSCAAMSHAKRDQRTDLTGKRALLTGGRAKIGMYIALRLLRDGAHTTITTRFPKDAVRRFSSLPDSEEWLHRLKVVGIDLRDPTQVISLADDVAAAGHARHPDQQRLPDRTPLAGRVRARWSRPRPLPLPGDRELPEMVTFDRISEAHPAAIAGALSDTAIAHHLEGEPGGGAGRPQRRHDDRARPQGGARLARRAPGRHGRRRRRAAARRADSTTPGPRPSARSTRWSSSRCSCATRSRRSCWSRDCARRWRRPRSAATSGGRTSSTSRPWRASSRVATRAPGTRTPTWRRPPSTC